MSSSPPEHNFHPAYRPDIDGLRAVAILSVVIFHAFPASLRGGFVGVDIFFVISGFLISSIIFKSLQRGDFSFAEFYAHRVKRIFPALILVMATCYVFGWFALLPDEFKQLGKHIAAGTVFVQNFVLWKEAGYFDTVSELKPLMHLWSLAIEEQFYLIYPLLIWGTWRLGKGAVLSIVVLIGLVSMGLNAHGIGEDAVKTFFLPHTRFWELLAGAVLAYLQLFRRIEFAEWLKRCVFHPAIFRHFPLTLDRDAALGNLLSVFGLLLITASVIGLHRGDLYPGWWALLPVAGAFMLILAGSGAWINQRILASRPMIFIGLISYPLYLWHWPLLSFARIVKSGIPSSGVRIGAVCLSIFLAWLTYRFLEKPIRFGQKKWTKTAALCFLAAAVGFAGFNALDKNGFDSRFGNLQSSLKQFNWPGELYREESCVTANSVNKGRIENLFCLGDAKTASVFLAGDSHSNMLYPGLAEIFPDRILNLAGAACLPFFDMDSGLAGQNPQCPYEEANSYLRVAENDDKIKTVIMLSLGPFNIDGTKLADAQGGHGIASHYIKWKGSDEGGYAAIFEKSMRATLERFLAKNKQVIFVIDVPELSFDPRSCVDGSYLELTGRVRKPCALPRAEYDKRNKKYREIVLSVLHDFPSVSVFDAAASLCDEQYCWAMKDGKILYRDYDHLSVEGSRYIARELVKSLRLAPL